LCLTSRGVPRWATLGDERIERDIYAEFETRHTISFFSTISETRLSARMNSDSSAGSLVFIYTIQYIFWFFKSPYGTHTHSSVSLSLSLWPALREHTHSAPPSSSSPLSVRPVSLVLLVHQREKPSKVAANFSSSSSSVKKKMWTSAVGRSMGLLTRWGVMTLNKPRPFAYWLTRQHTTQRSRAANHSKRGTHSRSADHRTPVGE